MLKLNFLPKHLKTLLRRAVVFDINLANYQSFFSLMNFVHFT